MTAREAASAMAEGWQAAWPECRVVAHPVADGGDGTLAVVQGATGADWQSSRARDARGRGFEAVFLLDGTTAWIEVAAVAGLARLGAQECDPWTATTAGVGDLLRAAGERGATRAFVCLGGSATNDGGCGMAGALGFRFLDDHGQTLPPRPADLPRLARIEKPAAPPHLEVTGLTDVRNPLLGPHGASRVYGPQKGASQADAVRLDAALGHLVTIARRDLDAPEAASPGAGAAGGLGFGLMTFLGARLQPGFEILSALTGLPAAIEAADLVVTGEGSLDAQTVAGKAPAGVARLARAAGKPVIALAGAIPLSNEVMPFDAVVPIVPGPVPLAEAMRHAGPLLAAAAARTARLVRLGTLL